MEKPAGSRVGRFLALSFVWSWAFWIPLVAVLLFGSGGPTRASIPAWAHVVALVAGCGPSLAAIVVTGMTEGRAAVRSLLRRAIQWRVGVWPHAAAWLLPIVASALAWLLYVGAGGSLPGPTSERLILILPAVILAVPFGPVGEELGWRGFLLPELETRYGGVGASLLIGVIWTAWHAPLFWAPSGTSIRGTVTVLAVVAFLVRVTGWSFVYTWLSRISKGSILPAIVMHTSSNADVLRFLFPRLPADVARVLDLASALPVALMAIVVVLLGGVSERRERIPRDPCARSPGR